MDKLEMIKENVQPLKSGRKIDTLKVVLNMDLNETSKRGETKMCVYFLEFNSLLISWLSFSVSLRIK